MTEPSSNAIQRLTEAIAASREVTDRQIAALNAVVERTSQNVDRAAAQMQQSAAQMQQSAAQMQQSAARIEHQVGLMSEHLTAIDIKLERLIEALTAHLRIAEKQADNIAELTKLVAAQANTVAALISRNA